jgi:hypothetical protein
LWFPEVQIPLKLPYFFHSDISLGGNVTIFGRREDALNDACAEIRASKISEDQIVHAAALDLSDYAKVNKSSSVGIYEPWISTRQSWRADSHVFDTR